MYVPFAVDDVVPAARYVSRATADSRLAAKLCESRRASRVGKRVRGKQETLCSATGDKLRDASALPDDILRRTVVEDVNASVDKRTLKPEHHGTRIEHELVAFVRELLLRALLVDPRAVRLRGRILHRQAQQFLGNPESDLPAVAIAKRHEDNDVPLRRKSAEDIRALEKARLRASARRRECGGNSCKAAAHDNMVVLAASEEAMRADDGRCALRFIGKTAERRSRAKRGRTSKKRSPVHFHSRIIALSIAMSLSVRPQSFKYASTFSRVFAPGYLLITS